MTTPGHVIEEGRVLARNRVAIRKVTNTWGSCNTLYIEVKCAPACKWLPERVRERQSEVERARERLREPERGKERMREAERG
jgi:hypothetical protein